MWRNFRAMPGLLQFLTVHALACSAFAVLAVVPNELLRIDGRVIPFEELWSSGIGGLVVVAGTLMPYSGVMILRRANWAREIYLFTLVFVMVGGGIFVGVHAVSVAVNLIIVGLIATYLYCRRTVNRYFASNKTLEPTP